jgi:hypothetical protein
MKNEKKRQSKLQKVFHKLEQQKFNVEMPYFYVTTLPYKSVSLSGLSSQKSHKNDGVKLSPCSALRCSCKGEQTAGLTGHEGQATFHICSSA